MAKVKTGKGGMGSNQIREEALKKRKRKKTSIGNSRNTKRKRN